MRQQIDLVQDHQVRRPKHVRIFDRLVLSLGHREDNDPRVLAEVEHCRTNEISDVFDHHDRPGRGTEFRNAASDHIGFQVATCPCIHLHRRSASEPNSFSIVRSGLVPLDHEEICLVVQVSDGPLQQGCLSCARRAHQIQSQDLAAGEPRPIRGRHGIILGEQSGFQAIAFDPLFLEKRISACGFRLNDTVSRKPRRPLWSSKGSRPGTPKSPRRPASPRCCQTDGRAASDNFTSLVGADNEQIIVCTEALVPRSGWHEAMSSTSSAPLLPSMSPLPLPSISLF